MIEDIIKYSKYTLYLPFAIITFALIRILSNFFLIRFNFLPTQRIGHMAMETELYLTQQKQKSFNFFAPHKKVANLFLLKLIKRKLLLLPPEFMLLLIKFNNFFGNHSHLLNLAPNSVSGDRDMNNIFDETEPSLKFEILEMKKGNNFLKKINTSLKNYVCVHIREEDYLKENFPEDKNLSRHSHRNCNVSNYTKAIQYLLDQNLTVIRMGKKGVKRLDIKNERFFDYANSDDVSEFLDIFLPAHCKFFVSSCSGLDFIAKIFRRPVLFTNQVPIGTSVFSSSKDMVIFKKYFSTKSNKFFQFYEIFERNIEVITNGNEFKKLKIDVIENDSLEILETTKDMTKFLDNDLEETNLEIKFKEEFINQMKKKNIYYLWHNRLKSRVGPSYLELNKKIYVF